MTRKEFAKAMGSKLEKIRKAGHLSITKMAGVLAVNRVTYVNNENGLAIPNFFTLYNLATQLDVSMDWFILDEEPIYRTEKKMEVVTPPSDSHQVLSGDIKELLDHMDKIPLLRYEILAQFHRFKDEHETMVAKAMKTSAGG